MSKIMFFVRMSNINVRMFNIDSYGMFGLFVSGKMFEDNIQEKISFSVQDNIHQNSPR